MTRTLYYTATTLDGFLADEHDSLDWLFEQDIDEDGPLSYRDLIKGVGAIAMGATTYQWILDHNARTGEEWAYAMPAWVFSHHVLPVVEGADVRFVQGPVAPVHEAMAGAAGLLDEIQVSIAPVTLGAGRPIFPRRFDLELLELDRNRAFACARYRVVGPRGS
jgi:dihydrofolate reductase